MVSGDSLSRPRNITFKSSQNFPWHIWGYRQLVHEVERLRTIQYDADDSSHEDKLLKLWGLLMPDVQLKSRVTKQWQEIGFQGDDPKTDFREEYPGPASHVLSHSHHPQYGYAFAVVGINLTFMAYHLLKEGLAKTHVYNVSKIFPDIKSQQFKLSEQETVTYSKSMNPELECVRVMKGLRNMVINIQHDEPVTSSGPTGGLSQMFKILSKFVKGNHTLQIITGRTPQTTNNLSDVCGRQQAAAHVTDTCRQFVGSWVNPPKVVGMDAPHSIGRDMSNPLSTGPPS
uniref:ELMO domain-containing protein n=1 Tax=Timema cristinae TaxID=61476 RepID=A0A7R9CS85_TIMCR|nr:unnamed protein product [Timema cristinae]